MHRHHVYTYMYVRGKAPWLELSTALALHGALHGVLLLREELGDCHLPFQGLRAHTTKNHPHDSHPTCLERALRSMLGACVARAWARLWGASRLARLCAWALSSVSLGGAHLELLESLRACFHRLHPTQRALALKVLPDDPERVLAKVVIGEAIGGAEELAAEAERRGGRHTLTLYPLLCCDSDLRDSSTPSRLSRGARARGVICGPWNSDDGGREAS